MDIAALRDIVNAILIFSIGLVVFYKNPRNKANLLFMLFCLSVAYWDFVDFNILTAETFERARVWSYLDSLGPVLPGVLMLHFVILFTGRTIGPSLKKVLFVTYLVAIVMILFDIPTHLISGKLTQLTSGWELQWTLKFPSIIPVVINSVFSVFLYILSVIVLIKYIRIGSDPITRKQSIFIVLGFAFSAISYLLDGLGMFFDISRPAFSAFGLAILCAFIAYAMLKYEMFSISPISAAETIITTMSDLLFLLDKDGKIVFLNPFALKLIGKEEHEVIGKEINSYLLKNLDSNIFQQRLLGSITNSGGIHDVELTLISKAKVPIPLSLSCSPIVANSGEIRGIVCIGRDISERKLSEKELEQRSKDVERLNRSLVGREIKMIELKKKINALQQSLSQR